MAEIYINLLKNVPTPGFKKRLKINPKDNFEKILSEASAKIGVDAKILFSEDGAVIDNTGDLRDGETLYVSQGEKFCMTSQPGPTKTFQKLVKIGIIGPGSVGKSALTVRFTQKVFIDEYIPTFEDVHKKVLTINNESVNVDILDSSGIDELVVMRPNWFKGSEGFIMVYAINERTSFEALNSFHEQLINFRNGKPAPLILVGNKSDMESDRQVKTTEGQELAKKFNAEFFETSAKTDTNVGVIFEAAARKVYLEKFPPIDNGNTCKACLLL